MISSSFSVHADESAPALNQDLRAVVQSIVNDSIPNDDTNLIETGMLDSLALVNLILELESFYDISIDFDTLELKSLSSVNQLSAFVSGLLLS